MVHPRITISSSLLHGTLEFFDSDWSITAFHNFLILDVFHGNTGLYITLIALRSHCKLALSCFIQMQLHLVPFSQQSVST